MTPYKKASPGTTIGVADGTILPVDGFGTIEVDLNQPGTTTKSVKVVAVVYVSGILWNLLSIYKTVERWGKSLIYYKTKAVLGYPGGNRLFLTSAPARNYVPQQV